VDRLGRGPGPVEDNGVDLHLRSGARGAQDLPRPASLLLPKERILELYLNVAETGVLTFGVEAGAQRYFQRSAAELSQGEAGRLAAVLPSPPALGGPRQAGQRPDCLDREQPRPLAGKAGLRGALARHRERAPGPLDCR